MWPVLEPLRRSHLRELGLLIVPGVTGPDYDIARSEVAVGTEPSHKPRPAEREKSIFLEMKADGIEFEEWLVESFKPRLDDFAGVLPVEVAPQGTVFMS